MAQNSAIKGIGGGGSVVAAGVDTSIQYNSSGTLGGDSDFVWLTGSNALGIGTASPTANLHVVGDGLDANLRLEAFSSTGTEIPELFFGHYGGSVASPVATPNAVALGDIQFLGHNGSSAQRGARIVVNTVGVWSAFNRGTKCTFSSTPNNTTTELNVLLFDGDGSVYVRTGVSAPIKLQAGYHGGSAAVDITATTNVNTTATASIVQTYGSGNYQVLKGATVLQSLNSSGDQALYTSAGRTFSVSAGAISLTTNTGNLSLTASGGEIVFDDIRYVGTLNFSDAGASSLTFAANSLIHALNLCYAAGTPSSPADSIQFNNAGAFGGSSEFIWDSGSNYLGIGTASPLSRIHAVDDNVGGYNTIYIFDCYDTGGTDSPIFKFRSCDGTVASPLNTKDLAKLGQLLFFGYDGSAWYETSAFDVTAAGAWGVANRGSTVQIRNIAQGSTSAGATIDLDAAASITLTPVINQNVELVTSGSGLVNIATAVRVGTTTDTTDGNIRWTGADFEGRRLGAWVSLTAGAGGGGNTLDLAYDQGGAGSGRVISADSGAVQITTSSTSAGLLIDGTGSGNRLEVKSAAAATIFSIDQNGAFSVTPPSSQSVSIQTDTAIQLYEATDSSVTVRGSATGATAVNAILQALGSATSTNTTTASVKSTRNGGSGAASVNVIADDNIEFSYDDDDDNTGYLRIQRGASGTPVTHLQFLGNGNWVLSPEGGAGNVDFDCAVMDFDSSDASTFTSLGIMTVESVEDRVNIYSQDATGTVWFKGFGIASPIPFNSAAPDDDLDASFTATSIIGALNEIKTGGIAKTLQQAYVDGNTIAATSAEGAITFSVADTQNIAVLTLTQNDVSNDQYALLINNNTDTESLGVLGSAIRLTGANTWQNISSDNSIGIISDVNVSLVCDFDNNASGLINFYKGSGGSQVLLGSISNVGWVKFSPDTNQNFEANATGTGDVLLTVNSGSNYVSVLNTGLSVLMPLATFDLTGAFTVVTDTSVDLQYDDAGTGSGTFTIRRNSNNLLVCSVAGAIALTSEASQTLDVASGGELYFDDIRYTGGNGPSGKLPLTNTATTDFTFACSSLIDAINVTYAAATVTPVWSRDATESLLYPTTAGDGIYLDQGEGIDWIAVWRGSFSTPFANEVTYTDQYGGVRQLNGTNAGAVYSGFSDSITACEIHGYSDTATDSVLSAAEGCVVVRAYDSDGSDNATEWSVAQNLFGVANGSNMVMVVQSTSSTEADIHLNYGGIRLSDTGDGSPPLGMLQYNTSGDDFEGYTGSGWLSLTKSPYWTRTGAVIFPSTSNNVLSVTSNDASNSAATFSSSGAGGALTLTNSSTGTGLLLNNTSTGASVDIQDSGTTVFGIDNVGLVTGSIAKVVSVKTSSYPVVVLDTFKLFTNEGAGAEITLTLPTAAAGLTYSFYVQAAQYLRVTANTGDTIRNAGSVSGAAGYIRANTVGNALSITAVNATEWVVTSIIGTWTIDS